MLEAKTCKLKSLRKESDKAKIILLSPFYLVREKCCDRRPVQHSIAPNRSGISV